MLPNLVFTFYFITSSFKLITSQTTIGDRGICTFTNRVDGSALNYVDRAVNGTTLENCRLACQEEELFTCRSISFINQGAGRMFCYLSADTRSSSGAELQPIPESVYEEYVCELPPPTTLPPTVPPSNTFCESPEDYAFERVMGMAPKTKPDKIIDVSSSNSPTLDCLQQCLNSQDSCLAVVINYTKGLRPATCSSYNTAIHHDPRNFVHCTAVAFFEKLCIKGIKCDSLWTVERIPGFALICSDFRRLENITSTGECAEKCLRELMCKSMQYFPKEKICRLSSETRRYRPRNFRRLRLNVQYLENQCIKDDLTCKFSSFPGKTFPFIDKKVPAVTNLSICQNMCNIEKEFLCRSLTYDNQTRTCSLSACDTTCFPMRMRYLFPKLSSTYSICSRVTNRRLDTQPRISFG